MCKAIKKQLISYKKLEIGTTAQKMKFSIKDFFSKCDQIRSFVLIWSYLLEKFLMKNFIFWAVYTKATWKHAANVNDSHLRNIINNNLSRNSFSGSAKVTSVRSLLKSNDRTNINYYRPVSILNCFSKNEKLKRSGF